MELLPLAMVVTPNIPEAEVLAGISIETRVDARKAAETIHRMGPKVVVVKGGHLEGPPTDLFYDGEGFRELHAPRIDTRNTHGTGCTFASAIAAGLAKNLEPWDAVVQAKTFITEAIQNAYPVGQGHGPSIILSYGLTPVTAAFTSRYTSGLAQCSRCCPLMPATRLRAASMAMARRPRFRRCRCGV